MYCEHKHLRQEGNFYICENCKVRFNVYEILEENIATCVECGTEFEQDRDLQICDKCVHYFDTDKLWYDHDKGTIDALDFNEDKNIRDSYRKHT
jgi:transcription initiation factor IIE alpha subunit